MNVSTTELQDYLHAHIPLSAAMQAEVETASTEMVVVAAPLAPNINHRDTVFGGSATALALLAAWSLMHLNVNREGRSRQLVIQRNTMEYLEPITGRFTARASRPAEAAWSRFERTLERRGRGRITVVSELHLGTRLVGRLEGEFVALTAAGRAESVPVRPAAAAS
ncbi:YiiD C-terminal domain-containing protein [Elongatibacter sediminis]|uniref:YiiD C-terminal domain-containing protein n=1 Tax=Elongatibacter sediminis TaxID=3119006 RepID=A0AAW9RK50_9GAMM